MERGGAACAYSKGSTEARQSAVVTKFTKLGSQSCTRAQLEESRISTFCDVSKPQHTSHLDCGSGCANSSSGIAAVAREGRVEKLETRCLGVNCSALTGSVIFYQG